MGKPQISLRTLLYGVLSAQICLAMFWWLDCRTNNPAGWAILITVVYVLGMGGAYLLAKDQMYRKQKQVKAGGHYECPYCGHVVETRKAFPVCPGCLT